MFYSVEINPVGFRLRLLDHSVALGSRPFGARLPAFELTVDQCSSTIEIACQRSQASSRTLYCHKGVAHAL